MASKRGIRSSTRRRALTSYVTHILEEGKSVLHERVKPEIHQPQIEIGTAVHQTSSSARHALIELRQTLGELVITRSETLNGTLEQWLSVERRD